MSYATIITKLGKAAISKAIADKAQISLTKMGVGQSKDVISDEWESLPEEAYKFSVSDIRIKEDDANVVVIQGIIEASVGGFVIRQVGIYGEDDKLFAVANVPETIKPLLSEGAAKDLTINFYIALSDTAVINLTIEESSKFASHQYVDTKFAAALVETKANELYAPKDHNHDEIYLKITDFEKYKNQKSAEEGEFLNKFIKDPTDPKISQLFYCLEDTYIYPITKGGLVSIKGKYLVANEGGDNKPISAGVTAYSKPYKQISGFDENRTGGWFRILFTIGDDVYFCQSTNKKLWKYDILKDEWTFISYYDPKAVSDDVYISPKYPLVRASGSNDTISLAGSSKTIKTQVLYQKLVFIEDFIVVKDGSHNILKAYKVNDEQAITEVSTDDLPLKADDIKTIKLSPDNMVSMMSNYYKNGDDIYAFGYKGGSTYEQNHGVLFKNKTRIDIPIQPIAGLQERICLLRGTRYILRRNDSMVNFSKKRSGMYQTDDLIRGIESGIYTDIFDIAEGKKHIRLPALVLSGEETEKGLKIAFLAKPTDFLNNLFYETTIPYEELKGLKI